MTRVLWSGVGIAGQIKSTFRKRPSRVPKVPKYHDPGSRLRPLSTPTPRWPKELQHSSCMNICTLIIFQFCVRVSCGHNLWIVTELWQWLVNKLETNHLRSSASLSWNIKYDDEIEANDQVICTWACVGPCSYSKDKHGPNELGCLQSHQANLLVWGCVIDYVKYSHP